MALNTLMYAAGREAELSGGLINAAATGFIKIYSGTQPAVDVGLTGTVLTTFNLASPAFTHTGGVASLAGAPITSGAVTTGTAGYAALLASDGTTVLSTFSVGTSGANLNLGTLSLVSGTNVNLTAFTITEDSSVSGQ